MKPEKDTFGQMIKTVLKGKEAFKAVKRDRKYIDAMNSKGYFSGYEGWHQIS